MATGSGALVVGRCVPLRSASASLIVRGGDQSSSRPRSVRSSRGSVLNEPKLYVSRQEPLR